MFHAEIAEEQRAQRISVGAIIVDHPLYAFFHRRRGEVHEQPYGLFEQSEIGQQLLGVGFAKLFDSLDLQDKPVIDQHVDLESWIIDLAVEDGFHLNLSFDLESA